MQGVGGKSKAGEKDPSFCQETQSLAYQAVQYAPLCKLFTLPQVFDLAMAGVKINEQKNCQKSTFTFRQENDPLFFNTSEREIVNCICPSVICVSLS